MTPPSSHINFDDNFHCKFYKSGSSKRIEERRKEAGKLRKIIKAVEWHQFKREIRVKSKGDPH